MSDDHADNTERKHRGLIPFKPGHSGNPAGRPRGARNKLGEAFLEELLADWSEYGPAVIARVRTEKPDVYLRVVASILPKDLNVRTSELDELSDDELVARIRTVAQTLREACPNIFTDALGVLGDGPDTVQ